MKTIQMQGDLVLNEKTYEVKDLVAAFTKVPALEVVGFFNQLQLNVPRAIRMNELRELLKEHVKKTRLERDTLADELNYRLRWFSEFSDTQYVNLLAYYNHEKLNLLFLENFWASMLTYLLEKGVSETHILDLMALSDKKLNLKKLDVLAYNHVIEGIFYDEEGHLDGLEPTKIRPVLFKSSTLVELREIGRKFGVDVPRRLKKTELLQAIFDELKERNLFDQHSADELSKKSVIMIQRFAMDNQIKVSVELKKEEIIEYILEHAHQTKAFYFKPETTAYDFEVEDDVESSLDSETKVVDSEDKSNTNSQKSEMISEEKTPQADHTLEPKEVLEEKQTHEETKGESEESVEALNEESVETLESLIKPAQVFINAGQYQGKVVDFEDDYMELDGAKEFLTEKQRKKRLPGELRFLFGLIKVLLLLVLRVVLLVVIVAFTTLLIGFIYASVMHFSEPESLASINEFINSFDVFGKGILEHISDFYRKFGL